MATSRTGAMNDARRLLKQYGVNGALNFLAQAADEEAEAVAKKEPQSSTRETAAAYRFAARAIRTTKERISHRANRVGF